MALTVQTNISSLTAQRDLRVATNYGDDTVKKLASGSRINQASDDPANLQISHKFTGQINCLDRANRNASEGQAVAELAQGALAEDFSILQRIRQLAIESANGTYNQDDRDTMQNEVKELCNELTRVACKTTYGGSQLLNGTNNGIIDANGKLSLQIGANANNTIEIDFSTSFTMSSMYDALGGVANGNGYNEADKTFDISSIDNAQSVLANIDSYITLIDQKRGEIGAVINRLESTVKNQDSMIENESDTRSRIMDTDYAKETASLVQANTMQNATNQMMLQANARPALVQSLLA